MCEHSLQGIALHVALEDVQWCDQGVCGTASDCAADQAFAIVRRCVRYSAREARVPLAHRLLDLRHLAVISLVRKTWS